MNDNQKTAVIAAINESQTASRGYERPTAASACATLGLPVPVMLCRPTGMSVSRSGIEISDGSSVLTLLHAIAHCATPGVFPAHGAEFCDNLLVVCSACAPAIAEQLREEFDSRGVHYTDLHRRRAVIKAVIQRDSDGTRGVEAIFNHPPQRVVGAFRYDRSRREVLVGDERFPLDRLRYLAKIA